jgi:hypothetical protein
VAFPQDVLPLRVHIAPGANPAGSQSLWQWVDITDYVRVASGVTITEGRSDEGAKVDPGKCTLTLDNTDGRFVPRNVLGPYYGQLAKGTPLRAGTIAISDTFARTVSNGWGVADSGQTWTPTGASQWSVNGTSGLYSVTAANVLNVAQAAAAKLLDFDLQFTVSVPAVMTGASMLAGIQCRYLDGNNYYAVTCEFDTGGTVTGKIRLNLAGVLTELGTTGTIAGLTYTANQKLRVRVQFIGQTIRLKIWPDGGAEPFFWSLDIGDPSITKSGLLGAFMWCISGNSNAKPFAVSVDDLEVEAIEFTGAVYEWPPRWDQSRKDVTVPITASGILRRLQQGTSPLQDAITRMMARQAPVELWPFTDDSDSTVAASALPGGTPAPVRAAEFAKTDAPLLPGAKQTMGVTASTVVTYKVRTHTNTGTWGVVWFNQLLAPPAAVTTIMSVNTSGTVRRWDIQLDSTGFFLLGYDSTGTQIYNQVAAYPTLSKPPMWIAYDLLVKQVGGNVDAKLLIYGVDPDNLSTASFFGTTVAGSIGSPTGGKFQGSLGFNEGRQGALAVFNVEPQFVAGAFTVAANGYIGETAADRIGRLCDEEGVPVIVEDGDSEPLGPQRTARFLDLLYSAADADLGILYERAAGLGYRPRGARYNRPVELALNFAVGDVAEPPEPTDDDQQLKNQWTVSRDSGSSAVASDQDSIDASGLLDDSLTVNVASDVALPGQASWRLATTTVDELRWPSIKLNLARNTGQIALWRGAQPFPRATIANEPSQVQGNAVNVTVLGYTQTLTPFGWDIDLNCTPSKPWATIGVYDSTATRYGAENSKLSAGVSAAATTLVVTFPKPSGLWSTDATEQPYDIAIAGERIRVPVGGMGAITGSGPYTQTITGAVRAINGISKALPAFADVQVFSPRNYAL